MGTSVRYDGPAIAPVRFRRAIDARSVLLAELTAREMRHLTLEDALELVILYAEAGDEKFERAACRWLSRLTIERENLTLSEAQLAAAALARPGSCPADRRDDAPVNRELGSRVMCQASSASPRFVMSLSAILSAGAPSSSVRDGRVVGSVPRKAFGSRSSSPPLVATPNKPHPRRAL